MRGEGYNTHALDGWTGIIVMMMDGCIRYVIPLFISSSHITQSTWSTQFISFLFHLSKVVCSLVFKVCYLS